MSVTLVIEFTNQRDALNAKAGDGVRVDRYRVALEAFDVLRNRKSRTREVSNGSFKVSADQVGLTIYVLAVPETVMHHTQRPSSVFIVMREALRVEELHDSRPRIGLHPNEGSETISMNTHEDLRITVFSRNRIRGAENTPWFALRVVSAPLSIYPQR